MKRPGVDTLKAVAAKFDLPFDWALARKKKYICERMSEIRRGINKRKQFREGANNLELEILNGRIEELEKQFNGLKMYLKYLNDPKVDDQVITDEEIEIARNYPVKEFLPENYRGKGNISCPFHKPDKHKSAQVNVTNIYCHTCNRKYDSLDLIMSFRGMDFKSAVKLLARS